MPRRLTDSELAEIRRRRPGVRASLACEGMYLTAETKRCSSKWTESV